jgi:hypothetical protein
MANDRRIHGSDIRIDDISNNETMSSQIKLYLCAKNMQIPSNSIDK